MTMIRIDGQEYDSDQLSVAAKEQLQSLHFVDTELARLNGQIAVFQTARVAYAKGLREALNAPAPTPFSGDTIKLG